MRKTAIALALFSLVAMTPYSAYAGKAGKRSAITKTSTTNYSSYFKGIDRAVVIVDNTGGGDVDTIAAGVSQAGPNGIIVVIATGVPYPINREILLLLGQVIMGSGVSVMVDGKEIPSLTKNLPELQINNRGIILAQDNQIEGLSFVGSGTGTAIDTSSTSGSHFFIIKKNFFRNLSVGIELAIPGVTDVEIGANHFCNSRDGIALRLANISTTKISKNTFKGIEDLDIRIDVVDQP